MTITEMIIAVPRSERRAVPAARAGLVLSDPIIACTLSLSLFVVSSALARSSSMLIRHVARVEGARQRLAERLLRLRVCVGAVHLHRHLDLADGRHLVRRRVPV